VVRPPEADAVNAMASPQIVSSPLAGWPALVLNADFRPLSYYPLSLWPWQDVIKAVFLDRVDVVAQYDQVVRSPSFEMRLPSVVCLRDYVVQDRSPAFTRFNVFLRDGFKCVYCGCPDDLTFDHLIPRHRGGRTTWDNIVTACAPCNLRKGGKMPKDAGMHPLRGPRRPSTHELQHMGRRFPPNHLHESWVDYLYWDTELEA
jgi:5-methylcytosine-specific restriction endonuclease McrA